MDILSIFPPDTIIKGAIGDGWYSIHFETTAINAAADIAKTCERHKENIRDHYECDPASYWIRGEIRATHPDFPYIRFVLKSKDDDIRSEWRVHGYYDTGSSFFNNENDPDEWRRISNQYRNLADFLDKITAFR